MKKTILLLSCLFVFLLLFTACGGTTVTWVDADGTVLYTEELEKDATISERELPSDNDEWHYIKWTGIQGNGSVTYVAERVAKTKITWLDVDGSVLNTATIIPGEKVPVYGLPNDTDDWQYTRWAEASGANEITYTAERVAKIKVTWKDVDGKVLHSESITANAKVPQRALPDNTGKWVYTEWKQETSGNTVTCTAQAVPAKTVIWKDADGKELAKKFIPETESIPARALPTNSVKWDYTEWVETVSGTANKTYTYTAKGEPKISYFAGNVFQVVGADLLGNPISLGTGFVLNKDGWFITNYHVLESAYTARGVFEIRNAKTGESYTSLDIEQISYSDAKKDILIGKLKNYKSIVSYYQSIPLQTNYKVGETTYSVGYPQGVVKAEMHKGKVLDSLSGLAEKLYNGITYISSDSYIYHGSSGGILVNERLEVIGMTSIGLMEGNEFVLGASIEAFNYRMLVQTYAKDSALKDIADVLHPKIADYIKLFRSLKDRSDTELVTDDTGTYYLMTGKTESTNNTGQDYITSKAYRFYSTGEIIAERAGIWSNGHSRAELLYGDYFLGEGLDSFEYWFGYEWPNGTGYVVTSSNINYSEKVDLTLRSYPAGGIGGYEPSDGNIKYAKEQFNDFYENLATLLKNA